MISAAVRPEVFEAEVKAAKAEGKYSEGVSDLSGSNIHIAYTKTVLKDPMGSGAELRHRLLRTRRAQDKESDYARPPPPSTAGRRRR